MAALTSPHNFSSKKWLFFLLNIAFHAVILLFYYKQIWNLHSSVLLDDQVELHRIWGALPLVLELWMSHKPLLCSSWERQGCSADRKANRWQLDNWTVAWKFTFSWTKKKKKTSKNDSNNNKTSQHPRVLEGSQDTLKSQQQSTGGCWHTEVWGGMRKSTLSAMEVLWLWKLLLHPPLILQLLCKPCRPAC